MNSDHCLVQIQYASIHRLINNNKSLIKSGNFKLFTCNENAFILKCYISDYLYYIKKGITIYKIQYKKSLSYFIQEETGLIVISLAKNHNQIINFQEYLKWNAKVIDRINIQQDYDMLVSLSKNWTNYNKDEIIIESLLQKSNKLKSKIFNSFLNKLNVSLSKKSIKQHKDNLNSHLAQQKQKNQLQKQTHKSQCIKDQLQFQQTKYNLIRKKQIPREIQTINYHDLNL